MVIGFQPNSKRATQRLYLVDGIDAVYYPQAGSTPGSVSLTILKDEQDGDGEYPWNSTDKTATIRIFKDDLVVIRSDNTQAPVMEKERLTFSGYYWRVKQMIEDCLYEWHLMVEREEACQSQV
ncbi:hypothetical protein KAR91_31275 [Candidatus Pacearchaeota archaeon]|nr:hypothetical protein [Candidatus Pacearchaeota archaeon]